MSLLRHALGTLLHPERTLIELAAASSIRQALWAVCTCGLSWAALSLALYADGRAPSMTLVPIRRADYYLWQACFVLPLLLGLWLVLTVVSHGASRLLGGRGNLRTALAVLGFTYAVPLLALFVLLDAVIYALFGFETLARAMRIYAPLAPLATLALTALALRIVYELAPWRAAGAALAGLTVQALLGGVLLR